MGEIIPLNQRLIWADLFYIQTKTGQADRGSAFFCPRIHSSREIIGMVIRHSRLERNTVSAANWVLPS